MNWGKGIAIALVAFITFIVTLVTIIISQKVDLESEDYYAQEINYQEQIDALAEGEIADKFKFKVVDDQLVVSVPETIISDSIQLEFFRPNDKKLDRNFLIEGTKTFTIPLTQFKKGDYKIQVRYVENTVAIQQAYPITI